MNTYRSSRPLPRSFTVGGVVVLCLVAATMAAPRAQAASFIVNVTVAGAGDGSVTGTKGFGSEPLEWTGPTAVCDNSNSPCEGGAASFSFTLRAQPAASSTFAGWAVLKDGAPEPAACAAGPDCTVTNFLGGTFTYDVTATFAVAEEPPEVTIADVAPADIGSTEAIFHGNVNPKGSPLTTCRFDVVAQSDPEGFSSPAVQSEPCSPDVVAIGEGETPVSVQATDTSLQPNTSYRVRLVAAKATVAPVTAEAAPFTTATAPPDVVTERAWSVSDVAATLTGSLNVHSSQLLACSFEWGTSQSYDQSAPCWFVDGEGGTTQDLAKFPVDDSAHQVFADLAGLAASSALHFRLVVTTDCGDACSGRPGLDATFHTLPGVSFPQRAYELVSAADTNGANALPDIASRDGEAYIYYTVLPVPGSENGIISFFRSSRSADGSWAQRYIASPAPRPGVQVAPVLAPLFSENLAITAFGTAQSLDKDDQNGRGVDVYRRGEAGEISWLSRNPETPVGTPQTCGEGAQAVFVSASGDQVLFESRCRLLSTDKAGSGEKSLYEWNSGRLSLVGVVPLSGTSCDGAGCVGAPLGSVLGSSAVSNGIGLSYAAVSRDGSRVVFQATGGCGVASCERLYVRIGGNRTVQVSASAPAVDPPVTSPLAVSYWGADAGANRIFFTSTSRLTADSEAPEAEPGAADLYAYEVDTGALRDITPHAPGGAGVKRVYDVSSDGRRVYFTSTEALEGKGAPGGPNLYLAELDDHGNLAGPLRFIATIDPLEDAAGSSNTGGVNAPEAIRELAANPDGSVLAFRDRLPVVPGRETGGLPQLFIYNAVDGELSCASCPTDGAAPTGFARLWPSPVNDPNLSVSRPTSDVEPHLANVGTDGSVVFQTATPLLPSDTNDALDVYEWRDNRVALVSSGVSGRAVIAGASASGGGTIFFQSSDSLVPEAQPGIQHIYAAVVGGGHRAAALSPPCDGADCRGPVSPGATSPSSASAFFHGDGNVRAKTAPKRCAKGTRKARRHGKVRCSTQRRCAKGSRAVRRRGKIRCVVGKPTKRAHRKDHERRHTNEKRRVEKSGRASR